MPLSPHVLSEIETVRKWFSDSKTKKDIEKYLVFLNFKFEQLVSGSDKSALKRRLIQEEDDDDYDPTLEVSEEIENNEDPVMMIEVDRKNQIDKKNRDEKREKELPDNYRKELVNAKGGFKELYREAIGKIATNPKRCDDAYKLIAELNKSNSFLFKTIREDAVLLTNVYNTLRKKYPEKSPFGNKKQYKNSKGVDITSDLNDGLKAIRQQIEQLNKQKQTMSSPSAKTPKMSTSVPNTNEGDTVEPVRYQQKLFDNQNKRKANPGNLAQSPDKRVPPNNRENGARSKKFTT